MTVVTKQLRQGDVLVTRVADKTKTGDLVPLENGRVVLAHGEQTGHHHSYVGGHGIAMFRDTGLSANGPTFLKIDDQPKGLEHQEHGTIVTAPGTYRVLRQRQFMAGMAARVED
jgi:hypothetical protein